MKKSAAQSARRRGGNGIRPVKPNEKQDEIKIDNAGRGKPCKDRPWCWQEKSIVRTICDVFDATNDVSSALAVYLALTEIASDEQSDTFTKTISEIARRAGLSYKSAARILGRFEALKIIAVMRNKVSGTKENAPSTYTLCTLGNDYPTSGNSGIRSSLPRIKEKSPEKTKKKVVEEPVRGREAAAASPEPAAATADVSELEKIAQHCGSDSEQLIAELQPHFPDIDVPRELEAYRKWMRDRSKTPTPRGFVRWLGNAQPALKPLPRKVNRSNGAEPPPPPQVSDEDRAAILAKFKAENRATGLVAATSEEPFR